MITLSWEQLGVFLAAMGLLSKWLISSVKREIRVAILEESNRQSEKFDKKVETVRTEVAKTFLEYVPRLICDDREREVQRRLGVLEETA